MNRLHFAGAVLAAATLCAACHKPSDAAARMAELPELQPVQKNHAWYYFTDSSFAPVDLPQNAPEALERPWTEAVRISSAARGYALVNRLGMVAFHGDGAELYTDISVFSGVTADSLVFSAESPVFYEYRSSFFNKDFEKGTAAGIQPSRPFLIEFNPEAHLFFPLVTYDNLRLTEGEIIGYFWNGTTWACSSKKTSENRVEFTYFYWEPTVALTELSPALTTADLFTFRPSSEHEYRDLNTPKAFSKAPAGLRELLGSIPREFAFSLSWRDESGTSPVQFIQQGNGGVPVNANAAHFPGSPYTVAVFTDGTTYVRTAVSGGAAGETPSVCACRLPLLPAGYAYGEFALSGNFLHVAWEQTSFYKTGRAGFLSVDLQHVLSQVAESQP